LLFAPIWPLTAASADLRNACLSCVCRL